ncbi:urea ABC transporter ATP-binding subunit UrtE [Celeribacter indicus]|uniref:ABC transporter-like protein n=1 Tax=Celeribacter indicus TaxID=1208324 RepID=A0A0B5E770_9RHOB|nr:urea ABC transporter ATP-binding subunit UrtE [Celeribacter indicus]AJE48886.1 ABC transporter-like protein [Celeribacter indicus]SDW40212.1 amino acid/amide ABC transporter ATP-binding protein 2, HAAT family [Celeribacter indicus]
MLDVKDLSLHYGGSQILYDVDISAKAGEVTCVMGTNGVGKTSLLKAISGTHPRSGGTMTLDGEDVGRVPAHELAKKGLAVVPQGRMIFPLLTVKENLESGFACLPKSEHVIPDEIFELFPILKQFMHRRGGDLSGGQQQQLAIARALIIKPKLLLLDEPTEGIQPNIIQQIGRVISLLRDRGDMAIVLVEQYFEFAYDLADQLVFMERGRVTSRHAKSEITKEEAARVFRIA